MAAEFHYNLVMGGGAYVVSFVCKGVALKRGSLHVTKTERLGHGMKEW